MSELSLPTKVRSRACFTQLLGAWAIEPDFLESGIAQVGQVGIENIWKRNEALGDYPLFSPSIYHIAEALGVDVPTHVISEQAAAKGEEAHEVGPPPYINYKGTAIIPVSGPLSKMPTSLGHMFGGSSTVGMRKALALAVADASVQRIMLHIDSPGGTVAGTGDLGDELFMAQAAKPTASFIEDLGASAAYWLASQMGTIYASPHAQVGSIGVYSVVHDSSQAAKAAGVKVHVIKTGAHKGAMVPGVEVTDAQLKQAQSVVDRMHQSFVEAVARGRGLPSSTIAPSADGRIFGAKESLSLGLVDAVGSFGAALSDFVMQQADAEARVAKMKQAGVADGDEQSGLKRRKGWKPTYSASSEPANVSVTFSEPKLSTDGALFWVSRNYTDSTGNIPLAEALVDAGVDVSQQEQNAVEKATLSDELAASDAKGNASNTPDASIHLGDASMADPPTQPAGSSATGPVMLSAEAHAALKADAAKGAEALRLVQELQNAQARDAKANLDSERERVMADYGLTKEQVSACPDLASLKAMESVARAAGRKGNGASGADPEDAKAKRAKEFDSWAAHEAWKDAGGDSGTLRAALRGAPAPSDGEA